MDGVLSSAQYRMPAAVAGILVGQGGGGPGGCATRGQADIRGLVTAGPGFVVRARCLLAPDKWAGLGGEVEAAWGAFDAD